MPKKVKRALTPEQVAEQYRKTWKAVTIPPSDMSPGDAPDAVSPELNTLKKRYKMTVKQPVQKTKKPDKMKMVIMEPKETADTRITRKTVLVKDGKVVGEQG
jgi:hypothetical protein